jgi:hypothetical protein
MNPFRFVVAAFVALLAMVPASCAQETDVGSATLEGAVAEALPDWWTADEVMAVEAGEMSEAPVPPRGNGKVPMPAPAGTAGGKPGALATGRGETMPFTAVLHLTDRIYEPLYSLDGTAMVQPVMEGGDSIEVTGTVRVTSADGAPTTYADVSFDQQGLLALGRPLAAFDFPTVIYGTDEAQAFLESRDAARAEGTMRKLMGDTGEEL